MTANDWFEVTRSRDGRVVTTITGSFAAKRVDGVWRTDQPIRAENPDADPVFVDDAVEAEKLINEARHAIAARAARRGPLLRWLRRVRLRLSLQAHRLGLWSLSNANEAKLGAQEDDEPTKNLGERIAAGLRHSGRTGDWPYTS